MYTQDKDFLLSSLTLLSVPSMYLSQQISNQLKTENCSNSKPASSGPAENPCKLDASDRISKHPEPLARTSISRLLQSSLHFTSPKWFHRTWAVRVKDVPSLNPPLPSGPLTCISVFLSPDSDTDSPISEKRQ